MRREVFAIVGDVTKGARRLRFFEIIPSDLFSLLASPNRAVYSDALLVLNSAFQSTLKIPRESYTHMLRDSLEEQLIAMDFADEEPTPEELCDAQGRARFLVRKLKEKGWIDFERGEEFKEYITVPDYAIRLIELFADLVADKPLRGFSYVYDTYSSLKSASTGKDLSASDTLGVLYGAAEKTEQLIHLLKSVYHNINNYCNRQTDCDQINDILKMHYDDFAQRIIEMYVKPLKVRESVPKYRVSIENALDGWIDNAELLEQMAEVAVAEYGFESTESAHADILRKIYFIKESYENLGSEYLDEIDKKVAKYTRATTQKLENLTNKDGTTSGHLSYLMMRLANCKERDPASAQTLDSLQDAFQLQEQAYVAGGGRSLYTSPALRERSKGDLVALEAPAPLTAEQRAHAETVLRNPFSKQGVYRHMRDAFGARRELPMADMPLADDNDYIVTLLAIMHADSRDCFYRIKPSARAAGGAPACGKTPERPNDFVKAGCYSLPDVCFEVRKEAG